MQTNTVYVASFQGTYKSCPTTAMQVTIGRGVFSYSFFNSALDRDECSTSLPQPDFTPGEWTTNK
jgi:hypothetical protein